MSKTLEEQIADERKFLHDMSNKLLIVQGMGSFLIKSIKKNENVTEKELDRSEKLKNATSEMARLITERREYIHSLVDD